jgi:hypothetical protein
MTVQLLQLGVWNANGLSQHLQELKIFLHSKKIDVMLISEAHITNRTHLKIPNYDIYTTQHPDGTAHAGTAIIIKHNIKYIVREEYNKENIQATTLTIKERTGDLTISAIYCPPKHNNICEDYEALFRTLGTKFIVAGDFNAKHTDWGSRITTTKGRELLQAMRNNNLNYLSTGKPTYWPTDTKKIPDVLDFCVIKGISMKRLKIDLSLDLSSDHTPLLVTLYTHIIVKEKGPSLCNRHTNWNHFRERLDEKIHTDIPLKTAMDIETAVEHLTKAIQTAAWEATPTQQHVPDKAGCPIIVKQMIAEKRKARKRWQSSRGQQDKQKFNKLTKDLKNLLQKLKENSIQTYLSGLTATTVTDHSLWKATRRLKRPQQSIPPIKTAEDKWARSNEEKATAFVTHLCNTFLPHDIDSNLEDQQEINTVLAAPYQMHPPIKKFRVKEVKHVIQKEINPNKAPGFDIITGKILQEISSKCLQVITMIFNSVLRIEYYPIQWKIAQIIMVPKPTKTPRELTSYRPISLLPVLSKVLEKLLLKRLTPILQKKHLIPSHQFGFRQRHGTIEQVHRVVKAASNALEEKMYCSAAFLDVKQAFDKVWHQGLCYKLKLNLPHDMFSILKSYLSQRYFYLKLEDHCTNLHPILAGVPQGSVLGPVLYLLYTADLPTTEKTMTATYADDTAVLATHMDPVIAVRYLQEHLQDIQKWLKKWKIRVNESKSVQITFTMKRGICPSVALNDIQLPQADEAQYLGIHLDRRLTWRKHIYTKRKQLGLKLQQLYWLIGRRSKLSVYNKLLIYKAILKPIWTYGISLWGTASNSNLEILQRFQNKVLREIVDAPWYVPNAVLHKDLSVPTVREEIKKCSVKYRHRLQIHPNRLAVAL